MTSIPGSQFMAASNARAAFPRNIFLVLGLSCLVMFTMNILAAAIPPDPMALEWRIGTMQQISGRSILLLLGLAMVLYSFLPAPAMTRLIAMVCLIVGILYLLSGVLVIRDGLTLQNQALGNIDTQAEEIRNQLQSAATSPDLPAEVTPQRIEEVKLQLEAQTDTLKLNARSSTTQVMVAVLGTQVVMGLGFLSLGRYGIRQQ